MSRLESGFLCASSYGRPGTPRGISRGRNEKKIRLRSELRPTTPPPRPRERDRHSGVLSTTWRTSGRQFSVGGLGLPVQLVNRNVDVGTHSTDWRRVFEGMDRHLTSVRHAGVVPVTLPPHSRTHARREEPSTWNSQPTPPRKTTSPLVPYLVVRFCGPWSV